MVEICQEICQEIRNNGIFMKKTGGRKKKHEKWIEWWSFNGALLTHILPSTHINSGSRFEI